MMTETFRLTDAKLKQVFGMVIKGLTPDIND